jgi:hypothetical protein
MCAFGMYDYGHQGGTLVKKPTGFMTNAIKLAEQLNKECSGDHRHIVLLGGGRARRAQVYPNELCRQIVIGLRNQMILDQRINEGMIGAVGEVDDIRINHELYNGYDFYDDISGKSLPKDVVIKAREEEIKQVYVHKIYDKVPEKECYDMTGAAPVGPKWIDIKEMRTSIT